MCVLVCCAAKACWIPVDKSSRAGVVGRIGGRRSLWWLCQPLSCAFAHPETIVQLSGCAGRSVREPPHIHHASRLPAPLPSPTQHPPHSLEERQPPPPKNQSHPLQVGYFLPKLPSKALQIWDRSTCASRHRCYLIYSGFFGLVFWACLSKASIFCHCCWFFLSLFWCQQNVGLYPGDSGIATPFASYHLLAAPLVSG